MSNEAPAPFAPLVWVAVEGTGLDPARDRILEVAAIVTSGELEIVAESPGIVIAQPPHVLAAMSDDARERHRGSGLLAEVEASSATEADADARLLAFVRAHCEPHTAPMAGSAAQHDRRFLRRHMPAFNEYLHYRIVDVTTIRLLASQWHPAVMGEAPAPRSHHRALAAVRGAIDELRYYRRAVFRARSGQPGDA